MNEEMTPEELEYEKAELGMTEETPEEPTEGVQEEEQTEEVRAEEEVKEEEPEVIPAEQYKNVRGALDEERTRRKESEKRLRDLEQKLARMEGMVKGAGLEEEEQQEEIDPIEATQKELAEIKARQEQMDMANRLNTMESEFAKQNSEYEAAKQFYFDKLVGNFKARGYTEEDVQRGLQQDVQDIVNRSLQNGANPAEKIFELAKTFGYQPKGTQATEKVRNISTAQQPSASRVTGSAPKGELTAEQIAELSEAEIANLPEETVRRAFGG